MSITVEISNPAKLNKVKRLLNAKTDGETLELALERVIEAFENKPRTSDINDLSDEFFDDLFAEKTDLTDGESIRAVIENRRESNF